MCHTGPPNRNLSEFVVTSELIEGEHRAVGGRRIVRIGPPSSEVALPVCQPEALHSVTRTIAAGVPTRDAVLQPSGRRSRSDIKGVSKVSVVHDFDVFVAGACEKRVAI